MIKALRTIPPAVHTPTEASYEQTAKAGDRTAEEHQDDQRRFDETMQQLQDTASKHAAMVRLYPPVSHGGLCAYLAAPLISRGL